MLIVHCSIIKKRKKISYPKKRGHFCFVLFCFVLFFFGCVFLFFFCFFCGFLPLHPSLSPFTPLARGSFLQTKSLSIFVLFSFSFLFFRMFSPLSKKKNFKKAGSSATLPTSFIFFFFFFPLHLSFSFFSLLLLLSFQRTFPWNSPSKCC